MKFETSAERRDIANKTLPNQRTTVSDYKSRRRNTSASYSTSVHHIMRVRANSLRIIDYISVKSLLTFNHRSVVKPVPFCSRERIESRRKPSIHFVIEALRIGQSSRELELLGFRFEMRAENFGVE